jgi:hypothetical protein
MYFWFKELVWTADLEDGKVGDEVFGEDAPFAVCA